MTYSGDCSFKDSIGTSVPVALVKQTMPFAKYTLFRNSEGTMQADIYLLSVQECRTSHRLVKEEVASLVLEITESSERKDTAVVCRMLPPMN